MRSLNHLLATFLLPISENARRGGTSVLQPHAKMWTRSKRVKGSDSVGAKITLTGSVTSSWRQVAQYFVADLETGGSSTAPAGLPLPSKNITYTVFVSLKAGRKVGLETAPKDKRWVIQGELCLDLPLDQCSGEIGVVAYQISEMTAKASGTTSAAASVSTATVPAFNSDLAQAPTMRLAELRIPEKFLGSRLNPVKTQAVRNFVADHHTIDKPITVCRDEEGTLWLVDGYRRYVVAAEAGLTDVPVHEDPGPLGRWLRRLGPPSTNDSAS